MIRKLTHVLAFCLLAIAVAGHAIADDSVRLEYKFTRNELLRYKVVSNMTISMGMDIPGMESMPGGTVQSVAVFRQRTKRILENGDAEIVIAIESMKITIDDQVEQMPVDKMPTFTTVVSKDGTVKSIEGMEKLQAAMGGMKFMDMGSFSSLMQSGVFPNRALTIGDTWDQELPFPMGGSMRIRSELLTTDTTLGKHRVAVVKQDFDADIDMTMAMPMPTEDEEGLNSRTTGRMSGSGTTSFSAEKGRMIRSDGKINSRLTTYLNATVSDSPGTVIMTMDMHMDYEMFLLPPEQAK